MIYVLGKEVDIEKTKGRLHSCSIHGQQSFRVHQSRIFTNDPVQEITVISQTENEQGSEIYPHGGRHQFELLTGDNGRHAEMASPDVKRL